MLDEPQIKKRGRNLDKKHSDNYNLESIIERIKTNEISLTVDEVVECYEKNRRSKAIFWLSTVEKWQVDHMTSKGL